MDAQILAAAKVLSDATKIEPLNGNNFKRWQQKVLAVLDFTKISCALHEPKPDVESGEKSREKSKKLKNWEMANTLCLNTISLCQMSYLMYIVILLLLKNYGMN
jgi:hypothetical protein